MRIMNKCDIWGRRVNNFDIFSDILFDWSLFGFKRIYQNFITESRARNKDSKVGGYMTAKNQAKIQLIMGSLNG